MPTKRSTQKPKPSVKKHATQTTAKKVSNQPRKKPPATQTRKTVDAKKKAASHTLVKTRQKQMKIALVAAGIVLALIGSGLGFDYVQNANRAYPGVYVGDIAVGGKTRAEIEQLITERYANKLGDIPISVYASEDAMAQASPDDEYQNALLAEQISAEEAQSSKQVWQSSTQDLQASIDVPGLADAALAVGRENGGLATRLAAAQNNYTVSVDVTYDQAAISSLVESINTTLGTPLVESGITVENGIAYPYEGQDGYLVSDETFKQDLTKHLLNAQDESVALVAQLEDAPVHITYEQAQKVADEVTYAVSGGVVFQNNGVEVPFSFVELGSWVRATAEETNDGWVLRPTLDSEKAHDAIVSQTGKFDYEKPSTVNFIDTNTDQVKVEAGETTSLPVTSTAISSLDEALFGSDGKAYQQPEQPASAVYVELPFEDTTSAFTLDEAIDHGLICVISSFTTTFNTGAGTENRNYNIERASALLNNSVIPSQGSWSFNGTAGECSEATGFLDAGAIVDGEYASEFGGGICQVATTVFNAVFESGFPIDRRFNHSLYIASYPAGRDAAVSWPDLDFVWTNDSSSEVLLTVICDNGTLTATLYGVDPGYAVTSETGAWEQGEKFETRTEVDETLAPNTSYTKTRGVDGSKISVTRSVMDESGSLVRQDLFVSVYDPVTEVLVEGPKDDDADSKEDQSASSSLSPEEAPTGGVSNESQSQVGHES